MAAAPANIVFAPAPASPKAPAGGGPRREDAAIIEIPEAQIPRVDQRNIDKIIQYVNHGAAEQDYEFAKLVAGATKLPISEVWVPVYAGSANTPGFGCGAISGKHAAIAVQNNVGAKRRRPGSVAQAAGSQRAVPHPDHSGANTYSQSDDPRSAMPRPAFFALAHSVVAACEEGMVHIFKTVRDRSMSDYFSDGTRNRLKAKFRQAQFQLAAKFSILFRRHPVLMSDLANITAACMQRTAMLRPSNRASQVRFSRFGD